MPGPIEEGRDRAGADRGATQPGFDALVAKPYVAHQRVFNAVYPHSRHYYWKSHKLDSLTDEVIDVVVDQAAQVTSPLSAVPILRLGGAVARVADESTAFPYRDGSHDINIVASWLPEEAGEACVQGFFRAGALQPRCLRELHQRRRQGPGAAGIQRQPVDPTHGPQGQVRPDELLPDERQHLGRQPVRGEPMLDGVVDR
jgi:hypothetical protein